MSASAIVSIIAAVLAIARVLVEHAQRRAWIEAAAAAATLKGLQDADAAIAKANAARAAARDRADRDADGLLRDDDGFRRPD